MLPSSDTKRILEEWGRLSEHLLSKGVCHMPCSLPHSVSTILPVEGNGVSA